MELRLQKYLADCGIASRRKAEELILQGKVKVNGKIINELGVKINTDRDKVEFNGKLIKATKKGLQKESLNISAINSDINPLRRRL